jgi:hypothetical protein
MLKDSVMIGTVAVGMAEWKYVESLVALETPGIKMFNKVEGKQGVDEGHNQLIEEFLDSEMEWLFSMDSDAALHPQTIMRLHSWGEPFVSGMAVQRYPPFWPVVYVGEAVDGKYRRDVEMIHSWVLEHQEFLTMGAPVVLEYRPDDALYPIARSGAHCLLTHRRVFEAIEPPWYVRTGSNAKKGRGSDFYFTEKVQEAGFETYIDRSVLAGHIVHGMTATLVDFLTWDNVIDYESGRLEIPIKEN